MTLAVYSALIFGDGQHGRSEEVQQQAAPDNPDKLRTRKDSPHRPPALRPGRPPPWVFLRAIPEGAERNNARVPFLFTQRGESMNSLLLAVLVSCPPVADYPDADPAYGGSSSHQHRHRLFGWLRRHHHDNKRAGNGHAGDSWQPVAPAPSVEGGTMEAVTLEAAPTVIPQRPCHCARNGHAGDSWRPAAAASAPTDVSPPATAARAPRLVARPQSVPTSAEPPLATSPDDVPRQMPRGPMAPTGAEPPSN